MELISDQHNQRGMSRRRFVDGMFHKLCVLSTMLSAVALASLITVVLVLGSKYLVGVTPTILPDTSEIASVNFTASSAEVRYTYNDELDRIPKRFVLPSSIDAAEGATPVTNENGDYTIELDDGYILELTGAGGSFSRLAFVGRFNLTTFSDFISGTASTDPRNAGFFPPILGSAAILLVCLFTALPLGVGTAILMQEFSPRHKVLRFIHNILQVNIRNLAGVPSVVYGLLGLTAFVRMFGLLGAPGQYDSIDVLTLQDGTAVVGQASKSNPYTLYSDFFGELSITEEYIEPLTTKPTTEAPVEITATINMLPDSFEIDLGEVGTLDIPINIVVIDPEKLFGGPNTEPVNFPLTESVVIRDTAGYVIETFESGVQLYSESDLAAGDDAAKVRQVRSHKFVLRKGATIERIERDSTRTGGYEITAATPETLERPRTFSGSDLDIDDGTIVVGPRGGWTEGGIRFDASDFNEYKPSYAIQLGDEDAWYHLRLPLQTSVLAGGLTLMLVILPVIIIASMEALSAVPNSLRQGAFALGASKLQTVGRVTLPRAIPSVMTGTILAMSRAVGEAAPILVIGAATVVTFTPRSLMSEFSAMPLNIYAWSKLPNKEFIHVTASGIIILLAILLTFNAVAILIRYKLTKKQ